MRKAGVLALIAAAALACAAGAAPRSAGIQDPDTRAWFEIAEALASDAMEGRDIGSAGYDRAADVVAARFKAAGLKPAGDNGGWFQVFPVHESRVDSATLEIDDDHGGWVRPEFLEHFSVRASDDLPVEIDAPMLFAGYCRPEDLGGARGKVAFCLNTRRSGLTSAAERIRNAQAAGAVALIQVDDPGFTIEPARWPAAYARTITIADRPPPATGGFVVMTLTDQMFARIAAGSGRDGRAAIRAGAAKQPMPVFDMGGRVKATFATSRRDFTAKNVLAMLPGSDPELAKETLVLSAHLDGYGIGRWVGLERDTIYNGALDDAAYVGTLIRFADNHRGKSLKRSVVFAAFTGEEKGLLGAHWFVDHPTVPKAAIVADLNLDQLRPLFPLKLLTELAVDTTTLGTTAKAVAASMGVRIQPDPEPERSLLTRADHYPFLQAGIPATGFIFGYEPGTEAERRYREWYEVRYHRPQDDLTQPMDFQAAGDFNRFFYKLAEMVADADQKPSWTGPKP